jgi:hypothetical protein
MQIDQALRYREAEAGTTWPPREQWLEDVRQVFRAEA